jgi:predicted dehydrogenase
MKHRIAVIGTGMIATAGHLPAWRSLPEAAEVVAVADINEERARRVARDFGVPGAYGDWRRMLAESRPDIVSVCTPNAHHREPVVAALGAGAHVLCEKPAATCAADALAMFDAAERAGRVLLVGQSLRFAAASRAAKEVADSGRLGRMYYGEAVIMRRRGVPTWGQFHVKASSGGGPVYDLGVHALDLLFWVMGSPRVTAVSALAWTVFGNRREGLLTDLADGGAPLGAVAQRPFDPRDFDVEDMAAALIRMEGGAAAALKTSWAANIPQNTSSTMILGSAGGLTLDPPTLVANEGRYLADVRLRVPRDPETAFSGHWAEARHLIEVIEGREPLLVRREEVLNVMRTLDALYRSAAEGREVSVS